MIENAKEFTEQRLEAHPSKQEKQILTDVQKISNALQRLFHHNNIDAHFFSLVNHLSELRAAE